MSIVEIRPPLEWKSTLHPQWRIHEMGPVASAAPVRLTPSTLWRRQADS